VWGPGLLAVFISPTHKRAERRAPVRGSEFITKAAHYRGGVSRNRFWAKKKICTSD